MEKATGRRERLPAVTSWRCCWRRGHGGDGGGGRQWFSLSLSLLFFFVFFPAASSSSSSPPSLFSSLLSRFVSLLSSFFSFFFSASPVFIGEKQGGGTSWWRPVCCRPSNARPTRGKWLASGVLVSASFIFFIGPFHFFFFLKKILSHGCGGAAIVHPQGKIGEYLFLGKKGERQGILSLYVKI